MPVVRCLLVSTSLAGAGVAGAGCGASDPPPKVTALALPGGMAGIGLDDLRYSKRMASILVPAGRTGSVDLIDAGTHVIRAIGGFSAEETFDGGHDFGATSVEEVAGVLYVTDRTSEQLSVVDLQTGAIVASVALAASPDYIRHARSGELWVTEPDAEQIEIFGLEEGSLAAPVSIATVAVPGGPESLVIDSIRGRAYGHAEGGISVAVDLLTREIVDTWDNGCETPKGIALDALNGLLVVGCAEGTLVVLDVANHGTVLSTLAQGAGLDVLGFDLERRHLYAPGGKSATLEIIGIDARGGLTSLESVPTVDGAHCATCDGAGTVYVCDPVSGGLLSVRDDNPASAL
jgi:hypothetical protein